MSTLAELFNESIAENHQICRQKKTYILEENEVSYQFKVPSKHTAGFRIEIKKLNLFGSNPPPDVAKMCDALFVIKYKEKDFIIAVEIKTGHKGDYKKQLRNGYRFCQWLVQLFQDGEHYSETPTYLGLLVWFPNSIRDPKNLTSAGEDSVKKSEAHGFDLFEYHNTKISLNDLLK